MKRFGLIGYPLGHSFSKQYFTEKFEKGGISDCRFDAFPIAAIEEFPDLLKRYPDLKGLSVTIPYKEQVLQYVDEISEEVAMIGATNSIRIHDHKLKAFNTDIIGFRESFLQQLKPHHTKALILGTGGASKAVQFVLSKLAIDWLIVSRRSHEKSGFIQYEQIDEAIMKAHTIIINCSPVGMFPHEEACPEIPYEHLGAQHYLFDLVYKPALTTFMKKGMGKGATVKNGFDMLVLQAEASWKIWNEV